ncbi:MAG: DNA recombination protein RmuC [Planctomycetota bacterium]|nr:MAG: DNA recombination protein RmuC [Planctomycetota bacterium]
MLDVIWLLIGLAAGFGAGVFAGTLRGRRAAEAELARVAGESSGLSAALAEVRAQVSAREAEIQSTRSALEAEKAVSADSKARLESAREHFAEQRRQIEQMQEKAREAFAALSAAALRSNNEQFVVLAEARFKPIREQLERYEQQLKALEEARNKAYGGITEKLESLQQRSDRLAGETGQLVAALRQSGAKGKWGEVTLQRVVELCGLTAHCDFTTQATLDSGQKPDLVVHLPGGRSLAIDSKVNTSAFLDAAEAANEDDRRRHIARYAADVRATLRSLSAKEYWKQLSPAPEFVVMFMPGEAFFAAALSQDRDLLTDGVDKGVLLASPTTLIALLLAVRHGWQQQQVAENAEKIAEAGRELFERLVTFVGHLDAVRGGLEKAADAYNKAVGNWASRTAPSARKLKDLGAADAGRELPDLEPMDVSLRTLPREDDAADVRRAV